MTARPRVRAARRRGGAGAAPRRRRLGLLRQRPRPDRAPHRRDVGLAHQRRAVSRTRAVMAAYSNEKVGDFPSLDFRCFIKDDANKTVSAWHGVPLKNADGTMNFLCEIPKETKAKMEVATDENNTLLLEAYHYFHLSPLEHSQA